MTQLAAVPEGARRLDELGKLFPTTATDPQYKTKIDSAARYLRAHYPVSQWSEALMLVDDKYVPAQLGGAVRASVMHRAAEITDGQRRTWRSVGLLGIGLSVVSIGVTIWAARRPCPTGGR